MSLDLKKETFLFGNIDIVNINFRRVSLTTLENFYREVDVNLLKDDKSLPWRFMKNFRDLLNIYENYLLSDVQQFYKLLDFFEKSSRFYKYNICTKYVLK